MMMRISLFVGIQIAFFVLTVSIRHFEKIPDNIIQILNDLVYLIAWLSLFRYNTETNWANEFITAFFVIITANWLIVNIIQIGVLLRELKNASCLKRKITIKKSFTNLSFNDPSIMQRSEVRHDTNVRF